MSPLTRSSVNAFGGSLLSTWQEIEFKNKIVVVEEKEGFAKHVGYSSEKTYPDWNARKFRESFCHRPGAGFVSELRDADEELLTGEEHVGALKLGIWVRDLHDGQVQLFFENRSRVFNLIEKN